MISIDDFKKVEIRAGHILSAEAVEGSEKLLKLSVDFGEAAPRTILSGIAAQFPFGAGLVGKKCAYLKIAIKRAQNRFGLIGQRMKFFFGVV